MSVSTQNALGACVARIAILTGEIDYRKNAITDPARRQRIALAISEIHAVAEAIDRENGFGIYVKEPA